ncbi:MAG: phospholipid/cholesterol/gamma-HCH transport system substrate-binding protein [Francisellaceae bacterium]|jgi:phospholipid/cholesterol/gamma-HCH transport system substrate-binding protein
MYKRSTELIVGVFVICACIALFFLVFKASGMSTASLSGQDKYQVTAQFGNIGGLQTNGAIRIAGVQVGYVKSIRLDQITFMAVVTMEIYNQYDKIPDDTSASIQTEGILGENYVSLQAGGNIKNLHNNSVIHTAYSATNLGSLISTFASGGNDKK